MPFKPWLSLCLVAGLACDHNNLSAADQFPRSDQPVENPYDSIGDIPLPTGYKRISRDEFAVYLRKQKLKKDRTVYLYNGSPKRNQLAQFAVLNLSTGDRDLQQCADAVMRLRSDYLFSSGQYIAILFRDNNGKAIPFQQPFTHANLSRYQQQVFGLCGSASLSKQLKAITDFSTIQPGDVLIRGGFPGHAVIVMDVAENEEGEKIYLLAQGYMPAQDMHVLLNPEDEVLSPWYKVNSDETIITPEYLFRRNELKRW